MKTVYKGCPFPWIIVLLHLDVFCVLVWLLLLVLRVWPVLCHFLVIFISIVKVTVLAWPFLVLIVWHFLVKFLCLLKVTLLARPFLVLRPFLVICTCLLKITNMVPLRY